MDERQPEPPSEWRYILRVPHDPLAPAIARDTVRSVLTRHALPELADTAVLLTSELLTNAWSHAPGPASLSLNWADKRLRASVWDGGHLPPRPTSRPEPYAEGGRGLTLVELCADDWGSFVMGPAQGKVVWFELLTDAWGRENPAGRGQE